MKKSLLNKLLIIVQKEYSLESLIKDGYTYIQIAECLFMTRDEGYVILDNDKYTLTKKGEENLKELQKFKKLEVLKEYKIKNVSLEKIFLPDYAKGGNNK
jgi:predicted methyltransferase